MSSLSGLVEILLILAPTKSSKECMYFFALSGKSLNDPIKAGETEEWQDWLIDDSLDQELIISQKQEYDDKKELLNDAMKILNEREKEIINARRLSENPKTLEELSKKYKISRERIRQIETKAFEKLQKSMINASKSKNLLPAN